MLRHYGTNWSKVSTFRRYYYQEVPKFQVSVALSQFTIRSKVCFSAAVISACSCLTLQIDYPRHTLRTRTSHCNSLNMGFVCSKNRLIENPNMFCL